MEISNLSDAEFKTLVIRMLKELIDYLNNIKKIQAEMKVTLSEIKKNLQGINSEMNEAENQINDLKHKEGKEFNQNSKKKKRIQKIKKLFEKLMKENSPNLVKEIDIQVQEAQRVPNKMDSKRTTPRHIIIKILKVKES